ncbi:hypothetical protein [uncultured Paraglaciecola sp.]|uniref:hypothetical protein n=1 Tax=uncultured Paraglaciecola sp. TaxID=1765024 RepID=UPI0026271A1C|nr:hypothetical protein [uncultured Paraglaciecola sp.]
MNQENKKPLYGLYNADQAMQLAVQVCDVLGHGRHNNAVAMLLETACAETCLGTYQDPTPNGAGWGLTQADQIAVIDVAYRTRPSDRTRILEHFGFDIRTLVASDLANHPLKALVFTRCFYKLIPDLFPQDLKGRAYYWKTHYNTALGKGKPGEYIEKSHLFLYQDSPKKEPQWPL